MDSFQTQIYSTWRSIVHTNNVIESVVSKEICELQLQKAINKRRENNVYLGLLFSWMARVWLVDIQVVSPATIETEIIKLK